MKRRRSSTSGFSLIEAIIALLLTSLLAGGGYLYIGRKIVDDGDPVRAAKTAGFESVMVLRRRNFPNPFGVCGTDAVDFQVTANKPGESQKLFRICCPAWYGNCVIRE